MGLPCFLLCEGHDRTMPNVPLSGSGRDFLDLTLSRCQGAEGLGKESAYGKAEYFIIVPKNNFTVITI